jgi:hypothetical protein
MRLAAAVLLAAGCIGNSRAQPTQGSTAPAGAPTGAWKLSQIGNLARLPGMKADHKDLLAKQGFFLVPQDPQPPKGKTRRSGEGRADGGRTQATHLFHVYERNDYVRFPSFITVDLAIDTTHAFFDAVLRDVEQYQLAPMLGRALKAMLAEAEKVRAGATTDDGRAAAKRMATFWAVAARLLDAKAAIPAALRDDTGNVVKAVEAAQGPLPVEITRAPFDVTQTRPRGHYTRSQGLECFFRGMSWLGMAAFAVEGGKPDVEGAALLARAWLGSKAGREGLGRVLKLTAFFAGGADATGLDQVAEVLKRVLPDAERATADQLVAVDVKARFQKELIAALVAPRIGATLTERNVRVLGRRAFEDAVAMQGLIPPLMKVADRANLADVVSASMGARAAASVMGSEVAKGALLAGVPAGARGLFEAGVGEGRKSLAAVDGERWSQDAYHGSLHALRTLLDPLAGKVPPLLATEAWRLRALQAFASGWAELRHDTILYGEQESAECDAEDLEPPPCWVEPVPELYRRLASMARMLEKRLREAGVNPELKPEAKPRGPDGELDPTEMRKPPAEKTKMLLTFLDTLAESAELELAGRKFDEKRRNWLTTIGGHVEWTLTVFANSDQMNDRDSDMAVAADVFTWRPTEQVLEVAVARPDLIYAVIPSPKGPVLARGAVMSYRELMHPAAERLTDEAWRKMIALGKEPQRPAWVAPLYAAPVGPVKFNTTQGRCGPMSGAFIECL